jgi:hypothetical protein
LQRGGFTIAQVVHDYGDACQTITELGIEYNALISTAEFRALNKCLDDAIAEAVTVYERQHALDAVADGARRSNEHLGALAHELHTLLGSAMLAFGVLRTGSVGIRGSTGDVLGRCLVELRDLVDRSLTEVRLTAGTAGMKWVTPARVALRECSHALHGLTNNVSIVAPEFRARRHRRHVAPMRGASPSPP